MMCERGLEMQKSLNQTYLGSMDKIKRVWRNQLTFAYDAIFNSNMFLFRIVKCWITTWSKYPTLLNLLIMKVLKLKNKVLKSRNSKFATD